MDLILAIVLIVLAFLVEHLEECTWCAKQIEKEFADNHVWMQKQFVLFWVQMVKSQAKLRYNKFTTKSFANKKAALANNKKEINRKSLGWKFQTSHYVGYGLGMRLFPCILLIFDYD